MCRLEGAGLDFNRPGAPAPLDHAIDFKRFFTPVHDALTGIPGKRQTSIFHVSRGQRRQPERGKGELPLRLSTEGIGRGANNREERQTGTYL